MNIYRYVSAAKSAQQPTAAEINGAKEVTNLDAILTASRLIGEYTYAKDDDLTKAFINAKVIEVIEKDINGKSVNRVKVYTENGNYLCRLYGAKDYLVPAHTLDDAERKKVNFGFCTSDGERVTETRQQADGTIIKVPVMYAKLS